MRNVWLSRCCFGHVKGIFFLLAVFICSFVHFSFAYAEASGSSLTTPINGQPHAVTMTTQDFNLTWQTAIESSSSVGYQVRASLDESQLGPASDSASTAWYSSVTDVKSLPFQSIEGVKDGVWYWQVRAIGENGIKSPWSEMWHVNVDSSSPVLAIQNPNNLDLFGGPSPVVDFSATIDDVNGVKSYTVQLDGIDKTKVILEGELRSQVTTNGSFVGDELTNGDHIITLLATDRFNNQSTLTRNFSVDKTAPVLSTNINDNQKLADVIQLSLSGVEDHPDIYRVQVIKDGQVIAQLEGPGINNTLTYDWDTKGVADGEYQLVFYGRDKAGNESTIQRHVVVDNTSTAEVVATTTGTDPLLEQLSKKLTQPFPTADSSPLPPIEKPIAAKKEKAVVMAKVTMPPTDQNIKAMVAPSAQGWRIFGVLWHWWLVIAIIVFFILSLWTKMVKSYRVALE